MIQVTFITDAVGLCYYDICCFSGEHKELEIDITCGTKYYFDTAWYDDKDVSLVIINDNLDTLHPDRLIIKDYNDKMLIKEMPIDTEEKTANGRPV